MEFVNGINKGKVELYSLSTCVWCKETKKLLNQLGIEYSYTDVDLLNEKEESAIREKISRFSPTYSFPTLIINDETSIVGFKKNMIKEIFE